MEATAKRSRRHCASKIDIAHFRARHLNCMHLHSCSLAEAHASLNDRATQLQLLQRALNIQETVFGPDHEEVRLTLEELADAYGRCATGAAKILF